MPQYIFKHPNKEEYTEIIQKMNDLHEFIDKNGLKWERVYTSPAGVVDGKMNIWSASKFAEKTGRYKGTTYGQLLDAAAEASQKREEKEGKDPIKEKFYENYSKTCRGREHPAKTEERIKNLEIEI